MASRERGGCVCWAVRLAPVCAIFISQRCGPSRPLGTTDGGVLSRTALHLCSRVQMREAPAHNISVLMTNPELSQNIASAKNSYALLVFPWAHRQVATPPWECHTSRRRSPTPPISPLLFHTSHTWSSLASIFPSDLKPMDPQSKPCTSVSTSDHVCRLKPEREQASEPGHQRGNYCCQKYPLPVELEYPWH